jgi:hypothetical protein
MKLYKQNKCLEQVEQYVLDNYNEHVKYVGSMKLSFARNRTLHFNVGAIVINKYKEDQIVTPKTKNIIYLPTKTSGQLTPY